MEKPRLWTRLRKELNFFRLHLLAFTIIPLISSAIFHACNGRFPVSFVDSMFLCYSAMTVTGLSTVNLSTLTVWQQLMLFLLMMIGDITVVSWIMVLVRKEYFKDKCEFVVQRKWLSQRTFFRKRTYGVEEDISSPCQSPQCIPNLTVGPYDGAPDLKITSPSPSGTLLFDKDPSLAPTVKEVHQPKEKLEPLMEDLQALSSTPESLEIPLPSETWTPQDSIHVIDEARTFSSSPKAQSPRTPIQFAHGTSFAPSTHRPPVGRSVPIRRSGIPIPHRTATLLAGPKRRNALRPGEAPELRWQGFGGFPGLINLSLRVYRRIVPEHVRKRLDRYLTTLPYVQTLEADRIRWLNIPQLRVWRNSDFQTDSLSDDELEELGGTEYRALRLLSYLVPIYFVGTQLFAFLLFAPWLASTSKYDEVFAAQPRRVNKSWFSVFQVMGAYTGSGLTLVDVGMVPFDDAYLMIFALGFCIFAGNHALPIFLRFTIWILSKFNNIVSKHKNLGDTLSFLLQHPRRCFIYLFPPHQTWFLVISLVGFSAIEWIAFPVLNSGLPFYEALSTGTRILDGLFQGLCVRASGLAIVPIGSLAPALLFLYLVFMYIAVYPVALSIRSTNVYEERSLGVFEEPEEDDDEPEEELKPLSGRERVNRYLGWHLRRQLSIDIWWLVWGVFVVTIAERKNIMDEDKEWFDLFRVLFELVSAFGGIGLSLGSPNNNYSFTGAMGIVSKLVIMVIMVRGRHRGLPVAVDRAVLLPSELIPQKNGVNPPPHPENGGGLQEEKKDV